MPWINISKRNAWKVKLFDGHKTDSTAINFDENALAINAAVLANVRTEVEALSSNLVVVARGVDASGTALNGAGLLIGGTDASGVGASGEEIASFVFRPDDISGHYFDSSIKIRGPSGNPTDDFDLANKAYVDSEISSLNTGATTDLTNAIYGVQVRFKVITADEDLSGNTDFQPTNGENMIIYLFSTDPNGNTSYPVKVTLDDGDEGTVERDVYKGMNMFVWNGTDNAWEDHQS